MAKAPTQATVTFGEIAPDDYDAKYLPGADPQAVWTDYKIRSRYENDQHVYMMGITSPGIIAGSPGLGTRTTGSLTGAAFVQLAAPTLLWVADWTAAKFKEIPSIPEFVVGGGWVLMDVHFEPGMLVVGADGVTPLYRISGTYVYGHTNPSARVFPDVVFTRPPWLADVFQRTLSQTNFQQNLINLQVPLPNMRVPPPNMRAR